MPDPLPTADESNSWVVYDDPQGRFNFLHPQALSLSPRMVDPNSVEFADPPSATGSRRMCLYVLLPPGNDDPEADRSFRDPQKFQRDADAHWAKQKLETCVEPRSWLPDADWTPWRVYRKELGVKTEGADDGAKSSAFSLTSTWSFPKRNECFRATSMTTRNDHVAFRTQAEAMIKSFHFGPWDGKAENDRGRSDTRPRSTPIGLCSHLSD